MWSGRLPCGEGFLVHGPAFEVPRSIFRCSVCTLKGLDAVSEVCTGLKNPWQRASVFAMCNGAESWNLLEATETSVSPKIRFRQPDRWLCPLRMNVRDARQRNIGLQVIPRPKIIIIGEFSKIDRNNRSRLVSSMQLRGSGVLPRFLHFHSLRALEFLNGSLNTPKRKLPRIQTFSIAGEDRAIRARKGAKSAHCPQPTTLVQRKRMEGGVLRRTLAQRTGGGRGARKPTTLKFYGLD